MAEPELIITDDEPVNEQSLQEGDTYSELSTPSQSDKQPGFDELGEEPEFELEAEDELETEVESKELEFSLEEDAPLPLTPTSEVESQQLVTDFDEQTLENLLTEPEDKTTAKPEITSDETEFEVTSDAEEIIPSVSTPDIIDTAHALPTGANMVESSLNVEESSTNEQSSTTGQVSTIEQASASDEPLMPEQQAQSPLHSGYSDDILSFPEGGSKPTEVSEPPEVTSSPSVEVTTDGLNEQEKIDFSDTVEIEHTPGTLHTQQAQQIELSILGRVDDLIQVLQNKSKAAGNPEQLPHKQFATGLHYIKHEKNHYLGAKWLRKAAIQGHAKAQMYLGMLFVQGKGVPRSYFHAHAWFSLAVCQDISEAKDARKKLERHLTAKEINASLKYAADLLDRIHL